MTDLSDVLALLRLLEWRPDDTAADPERWRYCPTCGAAAMEGHDLTCRMAEALAYLEDLVDHGVEGQQ